MPPNRDRRARRSRLSLRRRHWNVKRPPGSARSSHKEDLNRTRHRWSTRAGRRRTDREHPRHERGSIAANRATTPSSPVVISPTANHHSLRSRVSASRTWEATVARTSERSSESLRDGGGSASSILLGAAAWLANTSPRVLSQSHFQIEETYRLSAGQSAG